MRVWANVFLMCSQCVPNMFQVRLRVAGERHAVIDSLQKQQVHRYVVNIHRYKPICTEMYRYQCTLASCGHWQPSKAAGTRVYTKCMLRIYAEYTPYTRHAVTYIYMNIYIYIYIYIHIYIYIYTCQSPEEENDVPSVGEEAGSRLVSKSARSIDSVHWYRYISVHIGLYRCILTTYRCISVAVWESCSRWKWRQKSNR